MSFSDIAKPIIKTVVYGEPQELINYIAQGQGLVDEKFPTIDNERTFANITCSGAVKACGLAKRLINDHPIVYDGVKDAVKSILIAVTLNACPTAVSSYVLVIRVANKVFSCLRPQSPDNTHVIEQVTLSSSKPEQTISKPADKQTASSSSSSTTVAPDRAQEFVRKLIQLNELRKDAKDAMELLKRPLFQLFPYFQKLLKYTYLKQYLQELSNSPIPLLSTIKTALFAKPYKDSLNELTEDFTRNLTTDDKNGELCLQSAITKIFSKMFAYNPPQLTATSFEQEIPEFLGLLKTEMNMFIQKRDKMLENFQTVKITETLNNLPIALPGAKGTVSKATWDTETLKKQISMLQEDIDEEIFSHTNSFESDVTTRQIEKDLDKVKKDMKQLENEMSALQTIISNTDVKQMISALKKSCDELSERTDKKLKTILFNTAATAEDTKWSKETTELINKAYTLQGMENFKKDPKKPIATAHVCLLNEIESLEKFCTDQSVSENEEIESKRKEFLSLKDKAEILETSLGMLNKTTKRTFLEKFPRLH